MRGELGLSGCIGMLALLLASSTTGNAAAEIVGASDSFRVSVHGVVSPRCGVTQSVRSGTFANPVSPNNTAREDHLSLPFSVDCNGAFSISLASRSGGLKSAQTTSDTDFARTLPYAASVTLLSGQRTDSCASTTMGEDGAGCVSHFPMTDGGASGEGRIDVTLSAGNQPLLAGRYTDFLTITVSPELGGAAGI
jgi:hypothetical protein